MSALFALLESRETWVVGFLTSFDTLMYKRQYTALYIEKYVMFTGGQHREVKYGLWDQQKWSTLRGWSTERGGQLIGGYDYL